MSSMPCGGFAPLFPEMPRWRRWITARLRQITTFRNKGAKLSQTVIRCYPSIGGQVDASLPPPPIAPLLGAAAKELLIQAAVEGNGGVMRIRHMGGVAVQTNGKQFCTGKDARSEAKWEGAVEELERLALIQDRGYKGEVYRVTEEGYRVADILRGGS